MIVVNYEETKQDTQGATVYIALGSETYHDIEEVLLPSSPMGGNPVFCTKKFAKHTEYRWEVESVQCQQGAGNLNYLVRLKRRTQIDKQHYLKNILATRKTRARALLHPWAIVEVEFGHSPTVGKASGDIKGNKRYVDTIQLYSMPKRRLAVVTQVIERTTEDLVQVIPISSKQPPASEQAVVEVTSQLSNMAHYQKPSWAICRMIQTVTASRVIAPMVTFAPGKRARDTSFKTAVRGAVRRDLKDAMMYGVSAGGRVAEAQALVAEKALSAQLHAQIAELSGKMALFSLYEQVARDTGLSVEEMREMYPERVSE